MKTILFAAVLIFSVTSYAAEKTGKLQLGDKAVLTEVKMTDVSGAQISMAEAAKENALVVLFSCNTCPFVIKWEDRYDDIKQWADANRMGLIVLNSNYKKRSGDDSFEAMKTKAKESNYNFYYVVDKESKVANAFGGQTTPHVFLFDGDLKLAYKGAIDDSYKGASFVKQAYLKDAMYSVAAGKKVAIAETNPVGCGIKRKVE
jgi:thioredoxin-related protein